MPLFISDSRPYEQKHEHGKEYLAGAAYRTLRYADKRGSSLPAAGPSTTGLTMLSERCEPATGQVLAFPPPTAPRSRHSPAAIQALEATIRDSTDLKHR